jgi:hypothetical protein
MHYKDLPIPHRLQRFPRWRGYPIHFTVLVKANGDPDFKAMDESRRIEAFEKNLCHLCGWKLKDGPYAFIGGPLCVDSHHFVDGPMHVECAEYAAKACPFLSSPTGKYHQRPPEGGGLFDLDTQVLVYDQVANVRPDRMGLVVTYHYSWSRNGGTYGRGKGMPHAIDPSPSGQIVCVAGSYVRVDYDIMPNSGSGTRPVTNSQPSNI